MATPPQNDDTTRINAPLNFRHSNSLITTKVPHNPTKVDTGMSIIPGWNRPNANGQNSNINDKDYNGPDFKARPLKHWRHQLRVYNYNGPANNSRTASISDIERPGTTVYHFTPDCTCVTGEGGNSYIISNNQFGYETKDDNYSKITDVKIQNNGYSVVPYDATVAQINDPTNPAYKILTGVYNTNCINCSPEGNIIKSGIALQNEAYHSYSRDKLNSRCQTYEQNISTNKAPGGVYFDAQGIPLWPNDSPNGPQVFSPINFEKLRLYNKPCISQTIYKPNNVGFAIQGAVSGSTRLKKLVSDTMTMNGSSFYSARGATEANLGRYQGTNISSNYYVKTKPVVDSCRGTTPTPPIISVVDRDTYSITFSWQDAGNSLCNVVYYTVTYYAINILGVGDVRYIGDVGDLGGVEYAEDVVDTQDFFDNDNNNEMVIYNNENMIMGARNSILNSDGSYTDTENNIRYTIISTIRTMDVAPNTVHSTNIRNISDITSLIPNTNYLMSMTASNGNGTSLRSNVVLSSTSLNSNIVISIEPVTTEINGENYVYPHSSSIPISLTIRVSSVHSTTPIILSIINPTNLNVATLTAIEGSPNTYEVRLENAGTFNLQGQQATGLGEFNIFGNSKTISPLLTITKATPIFNTPWTISRSNILLIGRTYPFFPVDIISSIQLGGEYKIINVDGTESNNATFINSDNVESNTANFGENGIKIKINSYGIFRIRATSIETQNYKSISTTSGNIYASRNDPIIEFEFPDATSFNRKFTYRTGQTYDIAEINSVRIISPEGPQPDLRITYSAILLDTETISPSDVVDIVARTVTIRNAGSFRILAETNQTAVYNRVQVISPPVTIDKAAPTFQAWYLFQDIDTVLFVGRTYSFNPPVFTFPYPGPLFPSASIFITSYTSSSDTIARLIGSTTTFRIDGEGPFTITATTSESRNYKKVDITSEEIVSTLNTARVAFPSNFQTNVTYGEEYILKEANFIYPRDAYNFEGSASLSGLRIVVSLEQYNYFIIGRRITADITGTTSPPITSIDDTVTDKKIEYDISNGVSRHVIYIRNNTGISASTPATITNIIQTISDPRDFFITYSIVSDLPNVARISGTIVTLLKAGTFKILARTNQINPASTILNYTTPSPLITVNKATPVIRLNDLFPYTLQVGNTYSFNRAVIDRPVNIPPEILPITYISLNPDIVTILNGQPTVSETPSLRVNRVGSFRIRAETKPSERYNIGYAESLEEFSTNPGMPLIKFDPNQNFGPFTYRDTPSFNINEVIFINPIERHDEIEVNYYIPETNIVSLQDRTVTIHSAGEFTLRVKTIPSANFTISNILFKNITIKRYTPQFQEGWVAFINTRNVNYVFVGQTFEINPPILISPNLDEETFPYELRSIQYRIEPERRAEISTISETSTVVKVLEEGAFYIYATTTENSINYNVGVAPSRRIYGSTPERPIIEFPSNNEIIEITYGDDFSLEEAVFAYPEPIINIEGTATLSMTSTETRIILVNLQQYNAIVIGAYLRVTTTSSNIVNFIVVSRMIQTGQFIVVVERHSGETLDIGNYTIQNMTQEMRIPVGGSIVYSIVPPPAPIPPSYIEFGPVATILGTDVTINRVGSFTVQAVANVTPTFTSSSRPVFSTVNVKRATPTLVFEDNNLFPDQVLFTGRRYNFTPAIVTIPTPNSVIYEELEIEYRSEPSGVVTIFQRDISSNAIPIRVNRAVPFKIIAQTIEPLSGNFNRSAAIYSSNIYGAQENTPVLFFPGENENGEVPVTNLTYGFTNSTGNTNIYNVEQLADFRYPYLDNRPTDLTINYRINVDSSNIARIEMKEIIVDSVDLGTTTIFAPVITILRAGEFTLIAETNAGKFTLIGGTVPTVEFRASQPIYRKFNVQKATATFVPWYLFPDDPDNPLLAGQRRTFNPPVFITPIPTPPEILPSNFTYESSVSLIASVETSIVNGSRVLTAVINRVGQFQVVASIPETDNYRAIRVYSENEYPTSINRPIIRFPTKPAPTTVITYGDTYTLSPAYFYYPRLSIVESSGLYITHFARSNPSPNGIISTRAEVVPGTSPDYIQTVQILSAGTFYIVAQTNVIQNVFEKTYIYLNVTVNRATPTITFPGSIFPGQTVLIVGTSYDFLPAIVTIPSGVTDPIPQVRYRTNDASIATITTVLTPEGERRRINILRPSTTPITITAYMEATTNFTAAQAEYSNQRSVYYNTPDITVPSINNILTFGQQPQPTFQPAVVTNPASGSNLHRTISIQYAIVHESEDSTLKPDVATISGTTITLLSSGRFRIRATTVATSIFRSFSRFTTVVTVNRATPTLAQPWEPIPRVMYVGDTATITPPVFRFPLPVPPEILNITYGYIRLPTHIIPSTRIITITPATQPEPPAAPVQTSVRIESAGRFIITATTRKSLRYEQVIFRSSELQASDPRTPVINFPTSGFTSSVIFGVQPYQLNQAVFTYPSPTPSGVTITYTIVNQSRANVANIINGTTIRINNVGHFYILARTNSTNAFNVAERHSPRVTVTPAATTLQTTRWNAFPNITTPITLFVDQPLTIAAPSFQSPSQDEQRINGIRIVYFINNATTYINGPSFTVQAAGTLVVRAETRSNLNSNYSNARSINSEHITITFINRPPPRIVLNGETLVFQETSLPVGSPTFIQANPRGTGVEWFAVVNNNSRNAITNYARRTDTTTFRPPEEQTFLVPFNNIVTTLMTDMNSLFSGITNFNENIASWDTGRVTNMSNMFADCTNFNQRLERWNTAQVIDMSFMFLRSNFNQNISGWITTRVQNMASMFQRATNFNSWITNWDTRSVNNMQSMFADATAFNRSISWNTVAVTSMALMFADATSFNDFLNLDTQNVNNMNAMFTNATSFRGLGNIWGWNTRRVTAMNGMFRNAPNFSSDLNWNTSLVNDMAHMFDGCTSFNGYIGGWDTSRVTQMRVMFQGATSFNRGIGRWNTSQVINMTGMFDGATNFNQPINTNGLAIGAWNTGAVTDMSFMFRNARQFNQNIGDWNTSQVTNMERMFDSAYRFNNGGAVELNFYGFLNQNERNTWFRVVNDLGNIIGRGSHPLNSSVNRDTFNLVTPRRTMNWNVGNVRNMNFMFNEAINFVNVDLRTWIREAVHRDFVATGFRRNSRMQVAFTPFGIWLRADRGL